MKTEYSTLLSDPDRIVDDGDGDGDTGVANDYTNTYVKRQQQQHHAVTLSPLTFCAMIGLSFMIGVGVSMMAQHYVTSNNSTITAPAVATTVSSGSDVMIYDNQNDQIALLGSAKNKKKTKTAKKTVKKKMEGGPPLQYFGKAKTEFGTNLPLMDGRDNSFLADLVTSIDKTKPITSGFYRQESGDQLVYEYTYHEMKIIVDGVFHISDDQGHSVIATAGDVFYFPKGSVITFSSPSYGLGFFCGQRGPGEA